jgi:hypothetical protein
MEEYGKRIGTALLLFPVAMLAVALGWSMTIFAVVSGAILALVSIGEQEGRLPFRHWVYAACVGLIFAIATYFLAQYYGVKFFGLADSSSKTIRALPYISLGSIGYVAMGVLSWCTGQIEQGGATDDT